MADPEGGDGASQSRLPQPLLGLFRELLAHGVPLGVRDYLDGLRALDAGYGGIDGFSRDELETLAEALWVRSDDERAVLRRWFARLSSAPAVLLDQAQQAVDAAEGVTSSAGSKTESEDAAVQPEVWDVGKPLSGGLGSGMLGEYSSTPRASARIAIGASRDADGLALPTVSARDLVIGEGYQLRRQDVLPLRQLAVLWRRWRRSVRSGPKVEVDLVGTLRARCKQGFLAAPVMRASRRNAARLLVLADASPSMLPWQGFIELVQESLGQGRLGHVTVRWFANVPRQRVYLDGTLEESEVRDDCLLRHESAAVLVISDAGSARGVLNRRRAMLTDEFTTAVAAVRARLVWLNPMPAARWTGTTAALIGGDPRLSMLPLTPADMLRAVDLMRGSK